MTNTAKNTPQKTGDKKEKLALDYLNRADAHLRSQSDKDTFFDTDFLNHLDTYLRSQSYEDTLFDYVQKEDGWVWDSRPDADTDPRVGLLRYGLEHSSRRYREMIDADKAFQLIKEEQIKIVAEQLQKDPKNFQLKNRLAILQSATSFADYAKKTRQYPEVADRYLNIHEKSADTKEVYKTKDAVFQLMEDDFNARAALFAYLNYPNMPEPKLPLNINYTTLAEEAILSSWDKMQNGDEDEAKETLLRAKLQLQEETKMYNALLETVESADEWQKAMAWASSCSNSKYIAEALKVGNKKEIALYLEKTLGLNEKESCILAVDEEKAKSLFENDPNFVHLQSDTNKATAARNEYITTMCILGAYRDYMAENPEHQQQILRQPQNIPVDLPLNYANEMLQANDLIKRFAKRSDCFFQRSLGGLASDTAAATVLLTGSLAAAGIAGGGTALTGGAGAPAALPAAAFAMGVTQYYANEIAQFGESVVNDLYPILKHGVNKDHKATINILANKAQDYRTKCTPYFNKEYRHKLLTFARNRALIQDNVHSSAQCEILEAARAQHKTLFAVSIDQGRTNPLSFDLPKEEYKFENGRYYPKNPDVQQVFVQHAAYIAASTWEVEYQTFQQLERDYELGMRLNPEQTQMLSQRDLTPSEASYIREHHGATQLSDNEKSKQNPPSENAKKTQGISHTLSQNSTAVDVTNTQNASEQNTNTGRA